MHLVAKRENEPKNLTCNQKGENQKHDMIGLSDPVGGCDQKTTVGSSVLARDQQGPVGQSPADTSETILSIERGRERKREKEVDLKRKKTNSSSVPHKAG